MNLVFIFIFVVGVFAIKPNISAWDLTSISNDDPYTYVTAEYNLTFGFRQAPRDNCWTYDADCVVVSKSGNTCVCYGVASSEQYTIMSGHNGLAFSYSLMLEESFFFSDLFLICSSDKIINGSKYSENAVTVNYYTPVGCPSTDPYDPTPNVHEIITSWSFGTMFCFLLLIILLIYVFVGIPINYFVFKSRGYDIIPFLWFWKDLYSYTISGIKLIISCNKQQGEGKSTGTYNIIP